MWSELLDGFATSLKKAFRMNSVDSADLSTLEECDGARSLGYVSIRCLEVKVH